MSYRVCVDDLLNRDVDDGFAECHHVRVLVHVKLLLRSWNITSCLEEAPEKKGGKKIKKIKPVDFFVILVENLWISLELISKC